MFCAAQCVYSQCDLYESSSIKTLCERRVYWFLISLLLPLPRGSQIDLVYFINAMRLDGGPIRIKSKICSSHCPHFHCYLCGQMRCGSFFSLENLSTDDQKSAKMVNSLLISKITYFFSFLVDKLETNFKHRKVLLYHLTRIGANPIFVQKTSTTQHTCTDHT